MNLMPVAVLVMRPEQGPLRFEPVSPSSRTPTVAEAPLEVLLVDGEEVPVFGPGRQLVVRNLPEPEANTYYIVPREVAELARERPDLLVVRETGSTSTEPLTHTCDGLERLA